MKIGISPGHRCRKKSPNKTWGVFNPRPGTGPTNVGRGAVPSHVPANSVYEHYYIMVKTPNLSGYRHCGYPPGKVPGCSKSEEQLPIGVVLKTVAVTCLVLLLLYLSHPP